MNVTGYLQTTDWNYGDDVTSSMTHTVGPLRSKRTKMPRDLYDFHSKFGFHNGWTPTIHNLEQRVKMMQEELFELADAITERDKVGIVDALVDLVYFAVGTADLLKIDFDAHWDAVQKANMAKVRGTKASRPDTGGFDCIKPEGWVGPEAKHEEILEDYGFVIRD